MLCPKCNLREVEHGLCTPCQLTAMATGLTKKHGVSATIESFVTDEDIIEHHVFNRIKDGCRECGSSTFAYEAGVKEEDEIKWYVLLVNCGACNSAYEEIMEVRVNEPIKYEESE
jgi:hypothetical protein